MANNSELLTRIDELTKENEEKGALIDTLRWKDNLTGLSNRDKLSEDLRIMSEMEEVQGINLIILNVNFFSRINFFYGYDYGSEFIVMMSEFLKETIDEAGELYNFYGDKFAILMKEEFLDNFLTIVKERFTRPWEIRTLQQYVTISVGVVPIKKTDSVDKIIYKATQATEEAKVAGSNKISFYKPGTLEGLLKNSQLEYYLRRSVMQQIENFKIYYQPIIDTKNGKIKGFEALSRWIDEEMGFVVPGDYIELAEYLGIIDVIDHHVLKESCKFIKSIHDKGYSVTISVNISPKQLYDDDLVETLKTFISDAQLEYSYVNLEITENCAIDNVREAIRKINELKTLGMGVHLDDFGVGYSSLNTLKDIPVSMVKIDRKFIKDMHKSKYDYTFVKAIIELAHSADMKVCCEGVETQLTCGELRNLNSDYLQGYYFSKPLAEEDIPEILDKNFFEMF